MPVFVFVSFAPISVMIYCLTVKTYCLNFLIIQLLMKPEFDSMTIQSQFRSHILTLGGYFEYSSTVKCTAYILLCTYFQKISKH